MASILKVLDEGHNVVTQIKEFPYFTKYEEMEAGDWIEFYTMYQDGYKVVVGKCNTTFKQQISKSYYDIEGLHPYEHEITDVEFMLSFNYVSANLLLNTKDAEMESLKSGESNLDLF